MTNTEHRSYPLPAETDSIRQEFMKLMLQVLPMIDADVADMFAGLANKAAVDHPHEITDVEGLATALAGKMAADKTFRMSDLVDVEGLAEALDGYVPIKVGGKVLFMAAAAALGEHSHSINQVSGLSSALSRALEKDNNLEDLLDKDAARANIGAASMAEISRHAFPVGAIVMQNGPVDPGFLRFGEGGSYDRATYPDLAAWMDANGETAFGLTPLQIANGEFPDWRDYSPRTAGGPLGPAVGGKQEDALGSHDHVIDLLGFTAQSLATSAGSGYGSVPFTGITPNRGSERTQATGVAETRVKSFGVRWQIKAYGALVNQGTADLVAIEQHYQNMVAALAALPLTKQYVSAEQMITSGGLLTLAHGLGVTPKLVQFRLKCVIADVGYSVGDEIVVGFADDNGGAVVSSSPVVDASNISIRFSSGATAFIFANKSTGARDVPLNTRWRLIVRAWA